MTHGTQAPETTGERAVTHAPKTPPLAERHIGALERATEAVKAPATFTGVRIWTDDALALREITALVAALVSGEAKLVPTATHIDIEREKLERIESELLLRGAHFTATLIRGLLVSDSAALTPEDERHE